MVCLFRSAHCLIISYLWSFPEKALVAEEMGRRHADGTFTSDINKVLDDMAAKEFLKWLINTKVTQRCLNFILFLIPVFKMVLSDIGKTLLIFLLANLLKDFFENSVQLAIAISVLCCKLCYRQMKKGKTLNGTCSKYYLNFLSMVNLSNSFLFNLRVVLPLTVTRNKVRLSKNKTLLCMDIIKSEIFIGIITSNWLFFKDCDTKHCLKMQLVIREQCCNLSSWQVTV